MDDRTAHLKSVLPERYEFVRELGRGGMSTVYLARDRRHDRRVALKVLSPELVSGVAARRFLREIELAAKLTHPHILPLLDSGLVDDRPFYVMPFVEGRSLRERLDEEGALPVPEALRVARGVGEALAHAHEAGIVHRDIKPANILLTEGIAVVSDFGIATALEHDTEKQLTRPGHSVGTPGYMSPEQAAGDSDVDQRSDQYALACVLFEMLAGDPPYGGRNLRAILGRQMSQPVPRVSALRDTVPEGLDEVLLRALARNPADRYPTTRDFVEALDEVGLEPDTGGSPAARRGHPYVRRAAWAALAVIALVAAASWLGPQLGGAGATGEGVRGDTMRYAIFPFDYAPGTDALPLETLLHDALNRWEELSIVDAFETGEAAARTGRDVLDADAAAEVALSEGAGRFVIARVTSLGDSVLRVQARLYGVRGDGADLVRSQVIRSRPTLGAVDTAFTRLAAGLLFREPPTGVAADLGTSSLQALQAFDYGQRAVEEWQLARADSGFTTATDYDPGFAEAQLWVALARAWQEEDRAAWAPAARRAELAAGKLSPRDAKMATAIALQAEGRTPEACGRWRELTTEHREDFSTWYGLAHCLSEDTIVVREPDSPTGWAFRSSYHSAIEAYEEAFTRLPSILESFHEESFRALRDILIVSPRLLRIGRAESGDLDRFYAFPAWQGDTLAYVPAKGSDGLLAASDPEALFRMREKFRAVATTWVAEAPASARAREALAYGLIMTGRPGALDTLMRGRALAANEDERFDLARSEIWVRLVLSLPGDPDGLRRVRALTDSLLANADAQLRRHPAAAAGLATLVGRADLAASYSRRAADEQDPNLAAPDSRLLEQTVSDARALLTFASLGGPLDSVAKLRRRVERSIRTTVQEGERTGERIRWLVRPAMLMVGDHSFSLESEIAVAPVVAAQQALARGDTSAAKAVLDSIAAARRTALPFARTFDAQLPEMRLLMAIGDLEGARDWVDRTLSVLPRVDLALLSFPESVGPLIRIADLRAHLADELDRPGEARRWARAVTILWEGGDPFLSERLDALRTLIE